MYLGHSPLKCSIRQPPSAKNKVDIFLKFCFIFNEQTLKIDTQNYYPLIVNQIFFSSVERKVRNYLHQIRYQTVFLVVSNTHIINIGLSVIYFEKQCFLQLFVPKILQTIVSCQTRQTMKVSFLDKIQFF